LIVTRKTERPEIEASDSDKFSIFYAQTRLLGFRRLDAEEKLQYVSEIGPGPFFAFCGIGNPEAFFDDLSHWHVPVAGKRSFRDHHRYSPGDLKRLTEEAHEAGAIAFVTTEKDSCNILEGIGSALPIFVAVIDFVLSSENEFVAALERKLGSVQGAVA
jgi:tetraacyldisaccharide-1-P 4'-kinase